MYYFDHCATTTPHPEVIQSITEVMQRFMGNPSSLHRLGLEAEQLLLQSRELIANHLGASAEQIIFTSGGTESNNAAIKGTAYAYASRGKHLITSQIEHPSVHECFKSLEQKGFEVTYLPVDETGAVRAADVEQAIRKETTLVSIMYINNETGRKQPIKEIGERLRKHRHVLFHVDAVQAIGKYHLRPAEDGIDLMSLSAHKFRGPKGIGLLYRRKGLKLEPLLHGGGQESGMRPGTENVPLIVGMAKAFRMTTEHTESAYAKLRSLRKHLLQLLLNFEGIHYNGSPEQDEMAPHIVNVSFPGLKPEVLVHALEKEEIYISTRSACSAKDLKPSRILLAMGKSQAIAESSVRICLAEDHTIKDIEYLARALQSAVTSLQPKTHEKRRST